MKSVEITLVARLLAHHWRFILLIPAALLPACATTEPQSITEFKLGLSVVQTNSTAILLDFNRVVREVQLDRAVKLPKIKESDVAPGLDTQSISRWNAALEAMFLYASALEILAMPDGVSRVEDSLSSLGERVIALAPLKDAASSGNDELTQAISQMGKLIVETKAKEEASRIARDADPYVRAALLHMADMIGTDHATGGLRTMMWSNWTTYADAYRVRFPLTGENKREIAGAYAAAIEGRQASDAALGALHVALLNLADLHTAAAQGRSADASVMVALVRQEVAYAEQLFRKSGVATQEEDRR